MGHVTLLALLAASAPLRVLVLDISGDALSNAEAALVRDALAAQLQRSPATEVLTSEDLRRVLDVEAGRQLVGCDTGTDACLAELGAALGASRVLHGSAVRLGDGLVLSVALIDPATARALGRTTVRAASVEHLVDQASGVVAGLGLQQSRFPTLTVAGGAVAAAGVVAAAGLGATLWLLYGSTQDPSGDPNLKQGYLDYGAPLGALSLVAAGVAVVGLGALGVGLLVEGGP